MSRDLLRRAALNRSSWWLVLSVALYGLLMGAVGSRLTFYAEDYDFILNQAEEGPQVILVGTYGHWAPISRLVFLGETHLFGTWYPGYVAVNGVLLLVGLMAYATPIARSLDFSEWWVRVAFIQIALVPGIMSVVLLASNLLWVLSLFFGGLSAWAASHSRWRLAISFALVACLTDSALQPFWVLLAIGVSGAYVLARKHEQLQAWRRFSLAAVGLVLGAFFFGRIAGRVWIAPYFAEWQTNSASATEITSVDWGGALVTWITLVAAWSLLSMWPAAMAVVSDAVPRLVFLFGDYKGIGIGVWAAILIMLVLVISVVRSTEWLAILAIVLAPVFLAALGITLLRGDQLADRYVVMWLPPLVAFAWTAAVATIWRRLTSKALWGFNALRALGLTSAVVLILSLPMTLPMAANIDRPRWEFSQTQMALAQECGGGNDVKGLAEVSPVPTDDYLCELTTYLDSIGAFQ